MTVLVFIILFGLSIVVFPCEGKLSLPPEGDTFIVAPGTNVKIAWKFDDKIEDLVFRLWSYAGDKVLATISEDKAVNIKDGSPLPGIEIEKPSTLVLKNVDARYNGTYKFQVVGTTTTTSYVTVIVAVLTNATVNCSSPITVREGSDVTCLCEAKGGNPAASVTWYKNNVQIGDAGDEEQTLSLRNIERTEGGTYKCVEAQSDALKDEVSIQVNVNLMPIVTVNCSSPVTLNEGDNVKCLCKGEGGNPPANVTWYKDGVQQGVAGNKENMLSLSNVDKAESGTYKCAAQSHILTDEKSIEIIIYYAVPPAVTSLTSTPEKAFLGKTVVITCEAIAVPVPSYIITQNDTALVSTKKTYIIPVMDYTHAGSYKCIAKNILGSSSKTFSLSVVGLVQKTTVAMAIANSLNKVESVVVWHIVVSLLSGILVGVLLVYIIQYSRRRCRNSKLESNPEPPTTIKVDSIYQDLDLNRMNEKENYESLRSVNCDSNDPSGKNESDYTDLKSDRVVEDNYQSLTKT